jgi:hypothetical protein
MLFTLDSTAQIADALRALEIPVYRQILPVLGAELRRARRYQHTLSALVLSASGLHVSRPKLAGTGERAIPVRPDFSTQVLYLRLGALLRNMVRESDILSSAPESLLYIVFLTETSEEGALVAVRRFEEAFVSCGGSTLRSGTAEFPRDGFIVDDLVGRAQYAWDLSVTARTPPGSEELSHA